MRAIAVASILTLSGCFTTAGAGAGAGLGYVVGAPVKGALIGGAIGLRADVELIRGLRELGDLLCFWR